MSDYDPIKSLMDTAAYMVDEGGTIGEAAQWLQGALCAYVDAREAQEIVNEFFMIREGAKNVIWVEASHHHDFTQFTHYNPWTGEPCNCGWGKPRHKKRLGRLASQNIRMVRNQNQKAFRTEEGKEFLNLLENYADEHPEIEGMIPWLASRYNKYGDIGIRPDSGDLGWGPGLRDNLAYALPRWAQWFNARQHPLRQGVNIMEKTPEEIEGLSQEHAQQVQAARDRAYWVDNYGDLSEPMYTFGPEAGPYKGWQIHPIETPDQAEAESAALQHCLGSQEQPYKYNIENGNIQAYSLRDPQGYPHVSWHINPSGESIGHMQGRSGYPKEEYRNLISQFNESAGLPDEESQHEEELEPEYDAEWTAPDPTTVDELVSQYNDIYEWAYDDPHANIGENTEINMGDPEWDAIAEDAINGRGDIDKLYQLAKGERYMKQDIYNAISEVQPDDEEAWAKKAQWYDYMGDYLEDNPYDAMEDWTAPNAENVEEYISQHHPDKGTLQEQAMNSGDKIGENTEYWPGENPAWGDIAESFYGYNPPRYQSEQGWSDPTQAATPEQVRDLYESAASHGIDDLRQMHNALENYGPDPNIPHEQENWEQWNRLYQQHINPYSGQLSNHPIMQYLQQPLIDRQDATWQERDWDYQRELQRQQQQAQQQEDNFYRNMPPQTLSRLAKTARNWKVSGMGDGGIDDPYDERYDGLYSQPMATHDYDPRWDYSEELRPHWQTHPLVQQAQQHLNSLAPNGKVYAADLHPHNAVAIYVNGTGIEEPAILFDPNQHKGYEDQVYQTIRHEYQHALQDSEGRDMNEDEAENWHESKIAKKIKIKPYKKGYGKGVLLGDAVLTWNTKGGFHGDPHHEDVLETLGHEDKDGHEFHILPGGEFVIHDSEGEGSSEEAAKLIEEQTDLKWLGISAEEYERQHGMTSGPSHKTAKKKPKKDDPEYYETEEVHSKYCDMTVFKGPKKKSKVAVMTLPQQQRAWQSLQEQYPSTSQVVHTFPDNWTVQHHPNAQDVWRVGRMMRNCWQPTEHDEMDSADDPKSIYYSDPLRPMTSRASQPMAVHDPHGIPRAAFYLKNPSLFYGGGEDTPEISQALGPRNQSLDPDSIQKLQEYGNEYGYSVPTFYPQKKTLSSSPWSPHDPLTCPSCGHSLSEPHQMADGTWINTCQNCKGTFRVPQSSPLLKEFQKGWAEYPDILKQVNNPSTSWSEILGHIDWVEAKAVDEEVHDKPEDAFPSSSLGQYLKHVDKGIKHKPAPKKESYRQIFARVVYENYLASQQK